MTLPEVLTADWLEENGVAPSEAYLFKKAFPSGMSLTREDLLKGLEAKLKITYIFETILESPQKEEFSERAAGIAARRELSEKRIREQFRDANLGAQRIRNISVPALQPIPPSIEAAYEAARATAERAQDLALIKAEQAFNEAIADAVMAALTS